MPGKRKIKVILDTNLFISFLIGKKLKSLKSSLVNSDVILIFAEQNIRELQLVAHRDKFRRYFHEEDVNDLIDFIQIIGKVYKIDEYVEICRDPKDDFLLALAKKGKADYLVSGDKDLLVLETYQKTKITAVDEFEKILMKGTKS